MMNEVIKDFLDCSTNIDLQLKTLNKYITALETKIEAKREVFENNTRKLIDKKYKCSEKIINKGQEILNKITDIIDRINGFPTIDVLKEFDIIIKSDEDNEDTSINGTDELEDIEQITKTAITYVAYADYGSDKGFITIPLKYFDSNILDDETFISEICKKIKDNHRKKQIKEKKAAIAKLKKELDELMLEE